MSTAINVSDLLSDSDLCSAFTITRNPGQFAADGRQVGNPIVIQAFGAVRNTSGRELLSVPEGDRVHEMLTFRATAPMYGTSAVYSSTSDILTYQGQQYRVVATKPAYAEQGYYYAIAARMSGA